MLPETLFFWLSENYAGIWDTPLWSEADFQKQKAQNGELIKLNGLNRVLMRDA